MRNIHHVVDPTNKLATLFNQMLPLAIASKIHCLSIGKVVKYDHSHHTCNVQPLAKLSNGDKRPVYNYCIVPSSIWRTDLIYKQLDRFLPQVPGWKSIKEAPIKWKPLQYGSVVIIGACDREIDNLNLSTKRPYKIGTSRMHSFNDGIVLGVIKP